MNTLINFNQDKQASMNSMDMALLVRKRHDSVKRTIQTLENKGVIVQPQIVDVHSKDTIGRTRITECYEFKGEQGKRDSLVVVAQLSPEFTGAVIDRWLELERQLSQPQLPDFTNPVQAARAWADEFEQKQIALQQLELAKPKINHYDRIVSQENLLNATQVAQKLGMTAQQLNKRLDKIDVYNKTVKRGRAFNSWFVQEGLGQMKQTSNGYSQAMFTLKGEAWIVELLGEVA